MKKSRFNRCLVAAVVSLVMLFTACSKDESSAKTKSEDDKPKVEQKQIAGIIFQDDQFFHLVSYGMEDAAKKAGAKFLLSNSRNKPDQEIRLVNTYIARGVDAIVLSPLSQKSSAPAIKQAKEKGITIVTYNTSVDGNLAQAFVESDQFNVGAKTGMATREFIEKNLNGKANIAMLAFKSNTPEQSDARTSGFKSEVTKLPGVKIVAEQDAWLAEAAIKKAGDILTAHPDVNIIYAANEGGTVGSVMAVKNANKAGKIFVFGTDISDQLLGFLNSKDNILQAITGQMPYEIGVTAVKDAVKLLNGEKVEAKTTIPGVLLDRSQPDMIKKYKDNLKKLTSSR